MMVARVESFVQCIPELHALLGRHWEELVPPEDKPRRPLEPDYRTYAALEQRGTLLYITLRDYNALVGHLIAHVFTDLNSRSCLSAQISHIYVDASARGALGSRRMLRLAERVLQANGVRRLLGASQDRAPTERLWEAFKFTPLEHTFVKWLDAPSGAPETR